MDIQERELLRKLLNEAESKGFTKEETNSDGNFTKEIDDEEMITELKQGVELLSYAADTIGNKKTPKFLRKWLKRLWHHIKIAIANTLTEIACAIHPECPQ
jgi:hypothetical protein